MTIYRNILNTPIGNIGITTNDQCLIGIHFSLDENFPQSAQNYPLIMHQTKNQLQQYFEDPRTKFTIPITLNATPFQVKIFKLLHNLSVGKTQTYGDLAKQLNTSPSAIGNSCKANPIPIIIPCHRIISKQSIGGFGGQTSGTLIDIKRWLLNHEQKKPVFY